MGPQYVSPQIKAPLHWTEHAAPAATQAPLKTWWRGFGDPLLDRLEDAALAGNLGLQIAGERIRQARAQVAIADAANLPRLDFGVVGESQRSSTTLTWPPGIGPYRTYQAGFDASWEIDLFGRTRHARAAARAQAEAAEEAQAAATVSLLAELATDYTALRVAQARLAIVERNIATERQALDLAQLGLARGLATDLPVLQARGEMEESQAEQPPLRAEVARLSHAIALLTGAEPGALEAELAVPRAIPGAPAPPVAAPSVVLRNRPDIRQAERLLAAATEQLGMAVADLFPQFSLPLALATVTSYPSLVFNPASLVWTIGGQMTAPLYHGGELRARIRAARSVTAQDKLAYQAAVLDALRQVEDALVTLSQEHARFERLQLAEADDRAALDRTTRLYRAGLSGFLPVLVAQGTLFHEEDALALSQGLLVRDTIALYKALGAGW